MKCIVMITVQKSDVATVESIVQKIDARASTRGIGPAVTTLGAGESGEPGAETDRATLFYGIDFVDADDRRAAVALAGKLRGDLKYEGVKARSAVFAISARDGDAP
ncbi:MAG: hypothetical protein ACHREM_07155 [Polyangiales bacterium]